MDTFNNSYALLIGIDDPKLPSDRDATDIYDVLIDKNYAGYPKENVILLTLGKGTKKGVLNAFKTLEKKINIDSKIFIYYSGHGVIDNRLDIPAYFLQLEGWDSNKPEETGMKGDEVKQRLNGLIAERIIFFFDCCHAQGMTKGSGLKDAGTKKEEYLRALKKSKLKNPEGLLHEIDDEEGMAIISSCKDNQLSLYFKNDRNSLFTAYLLKILKGEHKTYFDDEHIKVLEVAGYLVEEIPKDAARDNLLQNPFVNLQIDKNFELSRVPKSKLAKKRPNDVQHQVQSVPVKKEVKKVFRKSKEANNAIIFVHGFSGDAHLSFGNMPELLMEEKKLEGWDMYPFGFNANVDPEMGKEIWATIKDINRITDNLSSAINYKFKQYDRIAIVAYSLGGLVAQRAILNLNTENRDRISHLLLFGTPSNGITNNAIKKLWENKIKELIKGRPFIKKLRSDWDNAFPKKYPFDLKVVSATKDEYASTESSLQPFNKEHWITVSGNHFTIVNITDKESDSYHLILNTLSNNSYLQKFTNQQEINLALGENDAVIRELLPQVNDLDETHLEHLIDALECMDRGDEAEEILKSHPAAMNDADMLQLLGDLYKRRYLDNSKLSDGDKAFKCYTKALNLAENSNQTEQICKNAIDLAFLNLMMKEEYEIMDEFAHKAIKTAQNFRFNKIWKLRALAEGHIYLGEYDIAIDYYKKVAKKASIKEKIEIYSNAYSAYVQLNDTENPEEKFLKFLKLNFLA